MSIRNACRLAAMSLAFALLAACGNKGPLVHPDTNKHAAPQPSSAQPTPSSANPETH